MSHDHSSHVHAMTDSHVHDHGDSGECVSRHLMAFHTGVCQEILFTGWFTTNALELFGSAVAIFLAAVLYEGLKYYREALHARAVAPTNSQVNIAKSECGNGNCASTTVVKYSMLSSGHVVQTLIHIIQSTASYLLMLVFMTYNLWLCVALILGLATGYFFFGWRKNTVVDLTEHCQ